MGASKCWNLERILDVELQHMPAPEALTMDELVQEEAPLPQGVTCDSVDDGFLA